MVGCKTLKYIEKLNKKINLDIVRFMFYICDVTAPGRLTS
jgi:hypothetical protein